MSPLPITDAADRTNKPVRFVNMTLTEDDFDYATVLLKACAKLFRKNAIENLETSTPAQLLDAIFNAVRTERLVTELNRTARPTSPNSEAPNA